MRVDVLRQAMQAQGIGYRDLSRKTGLHRSYLHRIMHGQHPGVSARTLALICRVLGVPIQEVLADELFPVTTREAG